jgi:crescentin
MRSRAATAEKLLAEVRQSVVARTEQIRVTERKLVDATVARSDTEKKVERLSAVTEAQNRQTKELEQLRATLSQRCAELSETVKARESSLAHAQEQIKSLSGRVEQLEYEAAANRPRTEKRLEDLNATIQRERAERAVAEGALETTRRDNARLQQQLSAERTTQRRGIGPEEAPEASESKKPQKSKNGKGAARGGKAAEAEPEAGAIRPVATS